MVLVAVVMLSLLSINAIALCAQACQLSVASYEAREDDRKRA